MPCPRECAAWSKSTGGHWRGVREAFLDGVGNFRLEFCLDPTENDDMTSVAALPAEIRAALKAGKTVTLKEHGKAFARVVPVKRHSPADLRRMCLRLNEQGSGDDWQSFVEWPNR